MHRKHSKHQRCVPIILKIVWDERSISQVKFYGLFSYLLTPVILTLSSLKFQKYHPLFIKHSVFNLNAPFHVVFENFSTTNQMKFFTRVTFSIENLSTVVNYQKGQISCHRVRIFALKATKINQFTINCEFVACIQTWVIVKWSSLTSWNHNRITHYCLLLIETKTTEILFIVTL